MSFSGDLMGRWYPWSKHVTGIERALATVPDAALERETGLEVRVRRQAAMRAADTSRRSNQVELWRMGPR